MSENTACESCWEYWGCPKKKKEKCIVYKTNAGRFCWFFENLFSPKTKRKFNKCWECPWYQHNLQTIP
ncbi:hypothetical protein ACFL42_02915 [Candidatus Omnitrophota bacterium]